MLGFNYPRFPVTSREQRTILPRSDFFSDNPEIFSEHMFYISSEIDLPVDSRFFDMGYEPLLQPIDFVALIDNGITEEELSNYLNIPEIRSLEQYINLSLEDIIDLIRQIRSGGLEE